MNKTLISALVVLVVLLGGYFIIKSGKGIEAPAENEMGTPVDGETVAIPDGKKMAFTDFVKQGGDYKCNVKDALSDMDNGGTVYISGGNFRGDFSTVAEGRTMTTSFITKDGYTYIWSPDLPAQGFKTQVDASGKATNSETYTWSTDQVGDYDCAPWTVDASVFVVPTNVTFTTI